MQAVITSVTSSRHHRSHQETIDQCIANITALADKRIVTLIHWVPGHAGLAASELVDGYANEAAAEAMELSLCHKEPDKETHIEEMAEGLVMMVEDDDESWSWIMMMVDDDVWQCIMIDVNDDGWWLYIMMMDDDAWWWDIDDDFDDGWWWCMMMKDGDDRWWWMVMDDNGWFVP